jgi:DNA repair protein RecO (recombination protein O)
VTRRASERGARRSTARGAARAVERDRALVLRRSAYGETSLVLRILTPRHGKVALVAKGAYRAKSAYCGVFDLFDTLEVGWRPARHAELGTAAEGRVLRRRRGVTAELPRYRAALAMLELADLAALPGQAERELFALLERWLDLLAAGAVDPALALVAFDLAFLQNLGLAPAFEACAACGTAAPSARAAREAATVPFAVGAGGRLCARCAQDAQASGRRVGALPMNVLRIAISLAAATPRDLSRFRVTPDRLAGVRSLVQRFLDYHLESRPRSRALPAGARDPR